MKETSDMFTAHDREEMNRRTEAGIERAIDNAHEAWRSMALDCLRKLCEEQDTFTVNDLRKLVSASPLKTHDNRAMGGILVTGRSDGWLKSTGMTIPSVVGHKTPIQIWKSLICKNVH